MHRRTAILVALFALGGFTVASQVYLLREFLGLFGGNELALGTVMGLWLLLSGCGAWLARTFPVRKGKESFSLFLLFILSVLPVLTLFKLGLWRTDLLPYGSMAGIWQIFSASFLALIPVCILNGFLFVLLTSLLQDQDKPHAPGRAYSMESLGGLAGGALVNFILLWHLPTFVSLRVLLVLFVSFLAICTYFFFQWRGTVIALLAGAFLTALFFFFPFERLTYQSVYREQEVMLDRETPYGKVTITRSGSQLNYYTDGALLFSSGNTIWNEECVHYAMLQRTSPKNVLLIGNGLSGSISEILKYRPERVDYVEVNPVLAELAASWLAGARSLPVAIFGQDARSFLRKEDRRYDMILVNMPDPSSLQMNRYYTSEFSAALKKHLTPAGVASFSLPSTADYVSPESGRMNAVFLATLQVSFAQVIIIPGTRNWFLASDSALSPGIGSLADARMADNEYVNSSFIDDKLFAGRADFILKNLPAASEINHDFHPVMYRHQLSLWLSRFGTNWLVVLSAAGLLFLLALLSLNKVSAGLFSGGFTGASLEVMVILAFQVALGYVISLAGVVIMSFMAGLAAGPWIARKLFREPDRKHLFLLLLLMAAMPLFLFGIVKVIEQNIASAAAICALLLTVTLATSLILGIQYTVAADIMRGDKIRAASRNYASDLFGSALGAFLVPVVFLPVIGIGWTMGILIMMNLLAAFIQLVIRKQP